MAAQGSAFRVAVQDSGYRVEGSGFRIWACRAHGSWFIVQGSGFWDQF